MPKIVSPSVKLTAFSCPHCGTLTSQSWFSVHCDELDDQDPLPRIWRENTVPKLDDLPENVDIKLFFRRAASGVPFLDHHTQYKSCAFTGINLNISKCSECDEIALWMQDVLLLPSTAEAPPANPDLPKHIRQDYDEAGAILSLSPRGAAALLRLCVQKLCKELGEDGKNINDDIGALVKKGLSVRVQQALDVVRVVGNSAVHPGQLDLKDDRATALSLFQLINIIAEKMISEPKHIDEAFANLPEDALKAIERRDNAKS
jgi:hypothetical protein